MVTRAEFATECPVCLSPIEVGDPIVTTDGHWAHQPCAEVVLW